MEEGEDKSKKKQCRFWSWVIIPVIFRLILIYFPKNLNLASRPEVSTPLTSLRRLAEGYWLKQSSISPYAGSMYHGSPLLLSVLGPLTVKRIEGQPSHLLCSLVFVIADIFSAMLLRAIGLNLQKAHSQGLKLLGLLKPSNTSEILPPGDIAALVYLWNPFTVVSCVGMSTSPVENLVVILSVYGACTRLVPLAAFGWVMATHLSLYPAVLIIPVIILLGYGPDGPPRKLFLQRQGKNGDNPSTEVCDQQHRLLNQTNLPVIFSWRPVMHFILWASAWSAYVLVLCDISLQQYGGLAEMFKRTYGFILTIEDLSPNVGVLWYFFAEVFDFFRSFFLIVFHVNILFMIFPLATRLNHRPCFLAFAYMAITSVLKSYPSVGDSALYLGLLALFVNELADMQFSFFLFCGYVGVSLLSPLMHNLWIWRGTGNANFYFATAIAYACFQIVLVVESVSAMLNCDRMLRKRYIGKPQEGKS
ncbi:phosphatidylinositol glycan anchor biosynthesis class U protein-like isoform X1 [Carica papaya]|uniref:phosphatidylinositol glycan anchor biosynthesis class U protein-like isoform X1 n=1 Tax=Carica papaya TaxID=3649 RepID=UPI000B8D1B69|nr:phosphatidylinositol glycan anchor biosynthesis class U protein-like isoform X1 [Carica papaya]